MRHDSKHILKLMVERKSEGKPGSFLFHFVMFNRMESIADQVKKTSPDLKPNKEIRDWLDTIVCGFISHYQHRLRERETWKN